MPESMNRNVIEEVILEKLQVMNNSVIHRDVVKDLKELTVHPILPDHMNAMVLQMTAWLWAQKPERKEAYRLTFMYPDGWFQHLRCDLVNRFPKLLRIIGYGKCKPYEIVGEFDCQVVYPKLNWYEAGPYLVVTKPVKGTWRFDDESYTKESDSLDS